MAESKLKSIFDMPPDEATETRLDAEAMADYEAGRVVPHAEVVKWLQSWGKPDDFLARHRSRVEPGCLDGLLALQREDHSAYIAQFNPRAAEALAERLIAAGNSLETFPHRGRPVPRTDLRELVSVNPYIIRYRVMRDEVVILRVRHSARRPTNP